jgi:3-oxoadipate enol-lactonase
MTVITERACNGDVELAYEVRGAGQPLLLIQGLGYARWSWSPIVDALAERYRVVFFDNRGIGESDKPNGPYTVAELAADAAAVLDAAGERQAHVVGASLGGMIAQELARVRPERVRKLVLACTTPGGERALPLPDATVRMIEEATSLEPEVALRRFVENALAPDAPPELVDRIYALRLANPPDPIGWLAQSAAALAFDGYDGAGAIAAPTMVVHGMADTVVDPGNAELLAGLIPRAQVELLPGAGHMLFWEQPDRFVELLAEFLG